MNAQNLISAALQNWLESYPTLDWLVGHPLSAIGLAILFIFLFWGLLNAIARFTERLWIVLLRSPLTLSQWLLSRSPSVLKQILPKPKADPQQSIKAVLARLEELRKEEDQLIAQVKEWLSSQR
jgi:hypothetical protein